MHILVVLRHVPLLVRLLPFALALIAFLTFTPRSQASFPGQNGRLAYSVYNDEIDAYYICTNATGGPGSARDCFGTPPGLEFSVASSADGSKLAVSTGDGIWVVNSDGTNPVPVVPGS